MSDRQLQNFLRRGRANQQRTLTAYDDGCICCSQYHLLRYSTGGLPNSSDTSGQGCCCCETNFTCFGLEYRPQRSNAAQSFHLVKQALTKLTLTVKYSTQFQARRLPSLEGCCMGCWSLCKKPFTGRLEEGKSCYGVVGTYGLWKHEGSRRLGCGISIERQVIWISYRLESML